MGEGPDRDFGRVHCAMSNCFNHNRQKTSRSFFRFPTDFNLCSQWILLSGRKDLIDRLEPKGNGKLNFGSQRYCSDHFSPATFNNPNNPSRGLRKNAIPTRRLGNANAILTHPLRNTNAIQQQSPEPMQISGFEQICSVKLEPNVSALPRKLQTPLPRPKKIQISGWNPACSVKLTPPLRLGEVQISGLYEACSTELDCNPSAPPRKLRSPPPRLGEVQISGLDQACSTVLDHNGSAPPQILLTPLTLPQSQSDPVPVGSTTPKEILQQMEKISKLENSVKTLRRKLTNAQKQMYKLRRNGEKMKNENLVLKSQIVSYNKNLIDISPAAMGDNILAGLLRHGRDKPTGRRYTESEKSFAFKFYRTSQKAYTLVHKRLNLPTPRMMNQELHRHRKAVLSVINDTTNAPEDELSLAVASCNSYAPEEAILQNDTANAPVEELSIPEASCYSYIPEEAILQNDTANAPEDELSIAVANWNSYAPEEAIPQNDTANAPEDE